MSKKLDDEYKKLISEEVPDLWERIEASLPEKNVETATASETEKVTPIWNKRNFKMFITAAACLCMLVISGGVFHLAGSSSENEMAADYMAEDAVAEGTAEAEEEAPAEEAVMNEVTEEAAEEAADIETGVAEETQKAGTEILNADRELASKEQFETGTREEAAMQDSVTMSGEAEKSESEAETAESLNGMFFDVVVMVDSIENTGEEEIYYATVISTENQLKEVDGKILFCIGDNEILAFEVGKTYSLQLEDVEPRSSTVHPYIVTEVYE